MMHAVLTRKTEGLTSPTSLRTWQLLMIGMRQMSGVIVDIQVYRSCRSSCSQVALLLPLRHPSPLGDAISDHLWIRHHHVKVKNNRTASHVMSISLAVPSIPCMFELLTILFTIVLLIFFVIFFLFFVLLLSVLCPGWSNAENIEAKCAWPK